MLLILLISVLGRVLAEPSVKATTDVVASQIDSTVSSDLHNFTEPITPKNDGQKQLSDLDVNPSFANKSEDSEGIATFTNQRNTSEVYQNDEKAELNSDDELSNSTDRTSTTEEEGEHIDWLDNEEITTDSEVLGENFNETVDGTLNGSDNETAEGVFDIVDTTDSPFDYIDESLFNSSNHETADKTFNNTFDISTNETASPSNLSGILQAWLSEQSNVTTVPANKPLGDGPLFVGVILNNQGDVCISINISIQPILSGTPLQLSQSYESTESYSMNNGSVTFKATDNDKAYNVTTEFLIHCKEKSCGVELVSVDVRNSTNRQAVVLHAELYSVNMGTPFEDITKRTLNLTDEIQLEISYSSVLVSVPVSTLGSFFGRHYVEIICGVGVLVIAICLTCFIVRKIRRGKNSFDTMM